MKNAELIKRVRKHNGTKSMDYMSFIDDVFALCDELETAEQSLIDVEHDLSNTIQMLPD